MRCASVAMLLLFLGGDEPASPQLSGLGRLPVKEITVFKDGHAFVLHQGSMPVDAQGRVRLDYLPNPVIGTFWAFASDKGARLGSVTAGRHTVKVERTALIVQDLLEANVGGEVIVTEGSHSYPATVLGFLKRTAAELEATSPPNVTDRTPQRSNLVLLKTAEGVRAVALERIADVRFPGEYKTKLAVEEERNLLTLKLDGLNAGTKTAQVGMAYLQKGVRWIPNYRVELDGDGRALVKLQATLLNELTDFENVTLHLVVGVPTFHFKETTDPIALNQALAQLSPYFEQQSLTNYGMSNSIMTQQMTRMSEVRRPQAEQPAQVDVGPDVANSGKHEDLFVFTVKNVTLKRGERMVVPVSEQTLPYQDVYTLDLPYGPPKEIRANIDDSRQQEMLRLLRMAKPLHRIRLNNTSTQPLTTAPALMLRDNRVLAQSLMTYTSPGAASDLTVTTAIDIKARKTEVETRRTPNAAQWHGTVLQRIDLDGKISLTNLRGQKVELEITRHVLGNVGEADHDGKAEMISVLEDEDGQEMIRPAWWHWYGWPGWWSYHNGLGRFTWKVTLDKGESVDLGYTWHYYGP